MADYVGQQRQPMRKNMPAQLTPLIGREQELRTVCVLLQSPSVRLLTLVGTAGIGKTCLAWHVVTKLQDAFDHGICFVSLASISSPDSLLSVIAQALKLSDDTGDQVLFTRLRGHLHEKHLLLVLDNFERVIAAAPMLVELLEACPYVKVLATSHEVLPLDEAHIFPLLPLLVPYVYCSTTIASLSQCAAVALFLQFARAVKPCFKINEANARVISEICIHLDGLPLAIQLVAAHIQHLSPEKLLEQLERRLQLAVNEIRNVPQYQQTLHIVLKWSYSLLNAEEQKLFRRLAIFVGGCTLQSLEAVCGNVADMSGVVTLLLDKYLVQRGDQQTGELRLFMLPAIRECALECLHMSGEVESTYHASVAYYMQLAEAADTELIRERKAAWLELLEQELDNLRVVLDWLVERKDAETTMRLCIALWRFWSAHGRLREGRCWLERALADARGLESLSLLEAQTLGAEVRDVEQAITILEHGLLAKQASMHEQFATASPSLSELTEREAEVLRLVAMGFTNAQIAEHLIISVRTVHAHVRSIYSKLGITSRSAATRYAIQHQIA